MLNRNAARHLLLVASILLCAFVYAGYRIATRGEAAPAEGTAAASGDSGVSGLLPDSAEAAIAGIPAANGDELGLTPPAAQSVRPLSPPPAVVSGGEGSGAISGLVPDESGAAAESASSGMMPGASLPIPGFTASSSPGDADGSAASTLSPPVLALPGMEGGGGGTESFGDGAGEGDEGDFAALPGFDEPVETSSAPVVLTPPPAATATASVTPPPAATAPVTPSAPPAPAGGGASSAAAAQGAGTALRPPAASGSLAPPAASATETLSPPAPPPARTSPPPPPAASPAVAPPPARTPADGPAPASAGAPARTPPPPPPGMEGMVDEDGQEFRSDSLRIYVVAQGDTLSSIAMRELGSGFLADNIFLLNRDVIEDPNHLMVGMKIRLPYANPGASGGYEADPAGVADVSGRRPTQGLGSTHTVVRGDTLSSIALQYYGSSAAWRFLYEANKAIVPNPNQLTVGMQLSVPPYAE